MNRTSWFFFPSSDCSSLTLHPKSPSQKVALVFVTLLGLTSIALWLTHRRLDPHSSGAYIFTYKAVIHEFYLPGCFDEGAAGVLRQNGEQEKKALEKNFKKMPSNQVKGICDSLHGQVVSACAEVNDERAANLRQMLEKIKPFLSPPGQQASVFLIECKFPEALSLPDGRIYFTVPLYEALRADEARAFVLAHELGHIENRHGFKILAKTNYFGRGLSEAFKPFFSPAQLHADEMEANLAACYLSHKASFDPAVAVGFLEKNFWNKTWGKNNIFKDLGFEHTFSEGRQDCLMTYLEIARREYLNQWEIKSYQPPMTNLGLTWQEHQKKILLAGAFLSVILLLLKLRFRRKKTPWRAALLFCCLIFLTLAGIIHWLCPEKNTGGNGCNCAGKIRVEKAVLREKADAGSHALALMNHGDQVWLTPLSERKPLDGRKVRWRQVKWGNTTGWVWDLLVKKQEVE